MMLWTPNGDVPLLIFMMFSNEKWKQQLLKSQLECFVHWELYPRADLRGSHPLCSSNRHRERWPAASDRRAPWVRESEPWRWDRHPPLEQLAVENLLRTSEKQRLEWDFGIAFQETAWGWRRKVGPISTRAHQSQQRIWCPLINAHFSMDTIHWKCMLSNAWLHKWNPFCPISRSTGAKFTRDRGPRWNRHLHLKGFKHVLNVHLRCQKNQKGNRIRLVRLQLMGVSWVLQLSQRSSNQSQQVWWFSRAPRLQSRLMSGSVQWAAPRKHPDFSHQKWGPHFSNGF